MSGVVAGRGRSPRSLVLALLGEYMLESEPQSVRAGLFIEVLEGAGVQPPATRSTLDRLEQTGMLGRERRGREVLFTLTSPGAAVLREATQRVRFPEPLHADGNGWTLVTFSVPEGQRTLRHRLRSTLTWEGFAPLRDGLWIAPGAVDLRRAMAALEGDLPAGTVVAFRAEELDGFPMGDGVRGAWDIEAIRAAHQSFIETWEDVSAEAVPSALTSRTMLVADWLALVRTDPGLPRELLGEAWPALQSLEIYRRLRSATEKSSAAEFARLVSASR
ncbi:PaaX family transcriptional regulator [Microbacterium sediminicola]|uniref:PaaX family transcriptional regulator n=1 Tax=Microbacterium sediminicola TaxID=415210 RepID=UPI0031E145BD